ncbi:MAG TPA: carboxypeptidase-like regulatory domain-containing protein [Fimbriimonas sp.]
MLATLLVVGCGGEDNSQQVSGEGQVSGVVFYGDGADENGYAIVRDARVFYDGSDGGTERTTRSNTSGAYTLRGLPANDRDGVFVEVRAEATIDGVRQTGVNVAQVFTGERTKNTNIALYPVNRQASIHGSVFYSGTGDKIAGARVFARPRDNSVPTSAMALTDTDGDYVLRGLRSGLQYDIQVNVYGGDTDFTSVTLNAGENREIDFQVDDTHDPNLPAPRDVAATAWTSPDEATRDRQLSGALEGIKNMIKPGRKRTVTRDASNGYPIEVDVFWTYPQFTSDVLGFGVYRESETNEQWAEFVRDPKAEFFADQDRRLVEGRTYTYGVTAISTAYDEGHGESPMSNTYSVKPLGGLEIAGVSNSTFRWQAASGAEEYTVYIFDEYPTANPTVRYQSPWVTGTSWTYNGPSLSNRTYYYLVVGRANDGDSFTLSPIGTFQP